MVLRLARGFPVVVVTGPRQSGKTTLVRAAFPDKPYVTLEDPDVRQFAADDGRGFLAGYPDGAIFDEVQRAPDLVADLQGVVDADRRPGTFILTGSQDFALSHAISQSLAGTCTSWAGAPCWTTCKRDLVVASALPLRVEDRERRQRASVSSLQWGEGAEVSPASAGASHARRRARTRPGPRRLRRRRRGPGGVRRAQGGTAGRLVAGRAGGGPGRVRPCRTSAPSRSPRW